MDFRNVTRLFADPEWDGPIEQDDEYGNHSTPVDHVAESGSDYGTGSDSKEKPIIDEYGCTVKVIGKTVSVYDANGKLLRQESIIDYTKSNILGSYASLDNFIHQWSSEEKKEKSVRCLWNVALILKVLKQNKIWRM